MQIDYHGGAHIKCSLAARSPAEAEEAARADGRIAGLRVRLDAAERARDCATASLLEATEELRQLRSSGGGSFSCGRGPICRSNLINIETLKANYFHTMCPVPVSSSLSRGCECILAKANSQVSM